MALVDAIVVKEVLWHKRLVMVILEKEKGDVSSNINHRLSPKFPSNGLP